MYQRIVVPLDGSRFAERALPDAERLARLTGATIHLVRVVDLTRYGQLGASLEYADADQARADEHSAAAAYLQSIAGRIVVSGLVAETEVRFGQPCRELVAATQSGDLLVMASHDLGGIARLVLGSVAEDVLRHAPVPILLIKAGAPEAEKRRSIPIPQVATAY